MWEWDEKAVAFAEFFLKLFDPSYTIFLKFFLSPLYFIDYWLPNTTNSWQQTALLSLCELFNTLFSQSGKLLVVSFLYSLFLVLSSIHRLCPPMRQPDWLVLTDPPPLSFFSIEAPKAPPSLPCPSLSLPQANKGRRGEPCVFIWREKKGGGREDRDSLGWTADP